MDLVGLCLVAHELPASATAACIAEASRLLRPGGTLAIMVNSGSNRLSGLKVLEKPLVLVVWYTRAPHSCYAARP